MQSFRGEYIGSATLVVGIEAKSLGFFILIFVLIRLAVRVGLGVGLGVGLEIFRLSVFILCTTLEGLLKF